MCQAREAGMSGVATMEQCSERRGGGDCDPGPTAANGHYTDSVMTGPDRCRRLHRHARTRSQLAHASVQLLLLERLSAT